MPYIFNLCAHLCTAAMVCVVWLPQLASPCHVKTPCMLNGFHLFISISQLYISLLFFSNLPVLTLTALALLHHPSSILPPFLWHLLILLLHPFLLLLRILPYCNSASASLWKTTKEKIEDESWYPLCCAHPVECWCTVHKPISPFHQCPFLLVRQSVSNLCLGGFNSLSQTWGDLLLLPQLSTHPKAVHYHIAKWHLTDTASITPLQRSECEKCCCGGVAGGSEQRKNILCQTNAALVLSCWAQTACWMVGGTIQSEGSDWLLCLSGGGLEGHLMVTAPWWILIVWEEQQIFLPTSWIQMSPKKKKWRPVKKFVCWKCLAANTAVQDAMTWISFTRFCIHSESVFK